MTPLFLMTLFTVLMSFFNSVMDATENEPNFNESVFRNWNPKFWLKTVSWQYARKLFGYKFDAWHIAKSLMIISFGGVVISAVCFGANVLAMPETKWFPVAIITMPALCIIWNGAFYVFYHALFKVK
jgi:hypothetical protein